MTNDTQYIDGMSHKSANVDAQEVTEEELKAINEYALSPLTAEDVFTFKLTMCDNEVDRDYECFSLNALRQLKELYIGKTIIKDHNPTAVNQVARIYATELIQDESKTTKTGEPYTRLVARCYMVKTPENESLITEIKAGIKKEVSVGCSVATVKCSVCGTNPREGRCRHIKGKEYNANGVKSQCVHILDGATDAYEVSLVAIPAQRNAGACKQYTKDEPDPEEEKPTGEENTEGEENIDDTTAPGNVENNDDEEKTNTENKDSEFDLEIKALESFIFTQKSKEDF